MESVRWSGGRVGGFHAWIKNICNITFYSGITLVCVSVCVRITNITETVTWIIYDFLCSTNSSWRLLILDPWLLFHHWSTMNANHLTICPLNNKNEENNWNIKSNPLVLLLGVEKLYIEHKHYVHSHGAFFLFLGLVLIFCEKGAEGERWYCAMLHHLAISLSLSITCSLCLTPFLGDLNFWTPNTINSDDDEWGGEKFSVLFTIFYILWGFCTLTRISQTHNGRKILFLSLPFD